PAVRHGFHQRLEKLAARERVERRDGLVEEQKLRPLRERERQRDLRLLTTRERAGLPPQWKAEPAEALSRELVVPPRVERGAELQQLAEPEAAIERMILRDEADPRQHLARLLARRGPEDENPALARLAQTDRELQQRRLAGAVRADERRDRPGRNRKRAVAERPERVVPLAERARLERGEAHAASSKNASRNPAAMSA